VSADLEVAAAAGYGGFGQATPRQVHGMAGVTRTEIRGLSDCRKLTFLCTVDKKVPDKPMKSMGQKLRYGVKTGMSTIGQVPRASTDALLIAQDTPAPPPGAGKKDPPPVLFVRIFRPGPKRGSLSTGNVLLFTLPKFFSQNLDTPKRL